MLESARGGGGCGGAEVQRRRDFRPVDAAAGVVARSCSPCHFWKRNRFFGGGVGGGVSFRKESPPLTLKSDFLAPVVSPDVTEQRGKGCPQTWRMPCLRRFLGDLWFSVLGAIASPICRQSETPP